ncbi:hypothetical protein [Kosakonia pseudosacchari]|nr:hypothetical protein [Kosakonia pseudosacchari]
MDANTFTVIGAFTVAIISGLLAMTASLSAKEKEIKLTIYEKLGIDTHTILERIHNNSQCMRLVFEKANNPNRESLIEAEEAYALDIDKIRELRVRIKFFDEGCFKKYENILVLHGSLSPEITGRAKSGQKAIHPSVNYTKEEIEYYKKQLDILINKIDETKEYITNKTAKEYNKTISSSKRIIFVTILLIVIFIITFILIPLKYHENKAEKEKVTLVHS